MNIKKISILTVVFVLITALAITATMLLTDKQSEYDKNMHISGIYTYRTPEELYEEADLIATCTFTGETETVYSDSTYEYKDITPVCTDLIFKTDNTLKGNADKEIRIRFVGGGKDNTFYIESSYQDQEFEKGQKYLIYLINGTPVKKDDNKNYALALFEDSYFKIDENNNLINEHSRKEDLQKIQEFYNSAITE